ncbi:MAG TPA: hypothetical protein VI258_04455, partial [Rhodanobacteraceae bacterium]
ARHDAPVREEPAPAPAAASAPAEQRATGGVSSDRLKAARKQRSESKPEPPPPKPAQTVPPPAPVAAPAPQPFSTNEQEIGQAKDADKSEVAGNAAAAGPASGLSTEAVTSTKTRRLSPTVPSSSVELQRDMQLAPADWLARVRDLVDQGRRQQAIESLRLFVRTHPDQRVPADLRDLLE